MLTSILTISITSIAVFAVLENENGLSTFTWNPFVEEKILAGVIETAHGTFAVPGFLGEVSADSVADTFFLTDEPGNWFKSETGGLIPALLGTTDPVRTPLTIIRPGEAVEFDLKSETDAKHTVTLLVPAGKLLTIDQDRADDDKIEVEFDEPGVHLFVCKVHPYMTGVVVVLNEDGTVPDVSAADLPFIANLGLPSLPATVVASVLTVIAPLESGSALGIDLGKDTKWDILSSGDTFGGVIVDDPLSTAGVGEVWVNTQFEEVTGQTTDTGIKPGSNTVLDVSTTTFTHDREMNGLVDFSGSAQDSDEGEWNNPHNMWTNLEHDVVYNGNWFGQWLNLIDRTSGDIQDTIDVGFAPTHIVTMPDETSDQFGILTLPLSAERDILKIEHDGDELSIEDSIRTGDKPNHPHGQWITSDGSKILIPNVFKGEGPKDLDGLGGSVTIMDAESGDIIREIRHTDSDGGALLLPVAVGIKASEKGYVANIGTGTVSVVDFATNTITKNIQVACFNPGSGGTCSDGGIPGIVLATLKLPIQTPVSPDGKWVATAVFSLVSHTNPDTIAIIDTSTDTLVAELPCPAGCHGANWGAKLGGGYYAYITSQHANVLTVVDPDPNGDGSASDAAIAGVILLADGDTASVTDGTGGQGILPLPLVSNGWVQDTVAACDAGDCSAEVKGWIDDLTEDQQDPS